MGNLFYVEVGLNGKYTEINLPATDYEMLDMLEKLKADQTDKIKWEILDDEVTGNFLVEKGTIFELNILARRIAEMKPTDIPAFVALTEMTMRESEEYPCARELINLSYSTDCCHLLADIKDFEGLGRFYADEDKGFIPGFEALMKDVYDNLDFNKIGRDIAEGEDGCFTSQGYVVQNDALADVAESLDYSVKKPEYQIKLELASREDGSRESVELPMDDEKLQELLGKKVVIMSADCRVPRLNSVIERTYNLGAINRLAEKLALMWDARALRYKMLLETQSISDLDTAFNLIKDIRSYVFGTNITEPPEVGREKLIELLGAEKAEKISPYVDLYGFGQSIIESEGLTLTEYGTVKQKPSLNPNDQQAMGGLEMK